MKRLTKRGIQQEGMIWFVDHENNDISLEPCEMSPHNNRVMLEKLADYEDKQEQGLLIELPVAEGSEVWTIMCGITGKNPTLFRDDFELAMLKHWGTAVFATRSEAEEALAKMGE